MLSLSDPATQALIQSVGGIITAVTTIVLAVLTYRYVKLTGSMLEEARISRAPNIVVDIETTTHSGMKLVIGNTGSTPAYSLKFTVVDSIPWRDIQCCVKGFASMEVIRKGITYLAPGRVLKYEAGYFDWHEVKRLGSIIEFQVSYEDHAKNEKHIKFHIDMMQYLSVLPESFATPETEIAKAIKSADDNRFLKSPPFNYYNKNQ